jgi:flagellar basal body L-ring protein FlgH
MNLKQLIQFFLLSFFVAGAMAGCATLEETQTPKPLVAATAPTKKPASRELGTLWSEDSMWNHIYMATSARVVGDIITIHLDERFRNRVLAFREVPTETEGQAAKPPERAVASEGAPAASSAASKSAAPPKADLVVRGKIEEVGPRGVYRISASDNLDIEGWEPYITLQGRVRDKDIDENDGVQIGNIVELNFDVLRNSPSTTSQGVTDVSW